MMQEIVPKERQNTGCLSVVIACFLSVVSIVGLVWLVELVPPCPLARLNGASISLGSMHGLRF